MTPFVVYTAMFGKQIRDRLRQPRWHGSTSHPAKYVCFTDLPMPSCGRWEVRQVSGTHLPDGTPIDSPRRLARYYKLMAHQVLPDCEWRIWHDACMVLRRDPWELVQFTKNTDMATFRHPGRRCAYAEELACVQYKKDKAAVMRRWTDQMRFLGYPPDYGLAETACLVRRDSPAMKLFNERWWQILSTYSLRDQLSFNFVCWELGITYNHIPGARLHTPYFLTFHH